MAMRSETNMEEWDSHVTFPIVVSLYVLLC